MKRAKSAAPSAGTTCSGTTTVSIWVTAAARMPIPPATVVASTAFVSASRSGESPASIALASLSEAARVERPNRDQR